MLGSVQIEIIKALAAVEAAMPGRSVNVPELASLIFDNTDKVSEAQRVTITRALSRLAEEERMVERVVSGATTRDVRWRLHQNLVRTLVRPEGTSRTTYEKRIRRWLKSATGPKGEAAR